MMLANVGGTGGGAPVMYGDCDCECADGERESGCEGGCGRPWDDCAWEELACDCCECEYECVLDCE